MPTQATESRQAVHVICDVCQRSLIISVEHSDDQIRKELGGWQHHPVTRTVACPGCWLILPADGAMRPMVEMFSIVGLHDTGKVHNYSGMGPPGNCQLCGSAITGTDIWLEHSQNYPKVPPELRRFPAHKQCWLDKTARFLEHVHIYDEHWRFGW